MLIGQIGLTLNNFSVRNIFNKKAWHPLPVGDGQKLSINAVTNGTYYYSFSGSFTEPWLGGRRPQSLSVSVYHHFISNGYFYKKSESQYGNLRISGAAVSFTKRLKWPDDYFIVAHTISYKHYNLNNYSLFRGTTFTNGKANDLSYGFRSTHLSMPAAARRCRWLCMPHLPTPPSVAGMWRMLLSRTSSIGRSIIKSMSEARGC